MMRPFNTQDSIKKQGWVVKKSKHMKKYHKRYMILKGFKLLCYMNIQFGKSLEKPTEVFDLSKTQYRVETHDKVKQKFYLIDETISQSRTFKALSELDRQIWVYKIRTVIASIKISSIQFQKTKSNIRSRGLSIATTFESETSDKTTYEMYDSDSDGSDDDFTANSPINNEIKIQSIEHPATRHRTMSKRKTDLEICTESFRNFRIRSLTIDSQLLPGFSDEEDEDENEKEPELSLLTLNPDDDFNKIYDTMDEEKKDVIIHIKCDEEIIKQLSVFGYDRQQILDVMKNVTNATDINEIRDKLDAETDNINTPRRAAVLIPQSMKDEIKQKQRQKNYVEQEIIHSEETYCQGLETLLNELIQPMFDNNYINKKYYKQIRSSLPELLEFHKDFLCHFEYFSDLNTENKTVVNVFKDYIMENKKQFLDINIDYIKDYQTICALFGVEFHGNEKLDLFLKEKRKEMKPLSSFLMMPIQRVPRYIYFLNHLQNSTDEKSNDYKVINDAVDMMEGIKKEINERKEKIENLAQCLQIQESLNGLKMSIVNDNRTFLKQFIFIKKLIKHQRLFFVFSDLLIIANEKWNVKKVLKLATLDVKIDAHINRKHTKLKKAKLPEFKLIAVGIESCVYIGKDLKTIQTLKKLIGKGRVKFISDDLRNRLNTVGSLASELNRLEKLYD
eukprot:68456_1